MEFSDFKSLFKTKKIPAIGNENADIYLLVEQPSFSNYNDKTPLSNQDLVLLADCMYSAGLISSKDKLLDEVRISNSLMHLPIQKSGIKVSSRTVTNEDINNLKNHNIEDINNTNPKLILSFGDISTKILTNFEYESYEKANKDKYYRYNDNCYICFNSNIRSNLLSSNSRFLKKGLNELTGRFIQAKKILNEDFDLKKESKCELIDIFDIDQVKRLEDIFFGYNKLVFDFEASGLNTFNDNFHIGGIGICTLDCTKSVYIHFYSFDRLYDGINKPPQYNLELLVNFFKMKKMVAFNKVYELSVCASKSAGLNFDMKDCEDVLMWLRALNKSSSLKDAAANTLGIDKWTDGVDQWVTCINDFIKENKPTTSMNGQRAQIEWLIENGNTLFDLEYYFKNKYRDELLKELKRLDKGKIKVFKEMSPNKEDISKIKNYLADNSKKIKSSKEKENVLEDIFNLRLSSDFQFSNAKHFFLSQKDLRILNIIKKFNKLITDTYKDENEAYDISIKLKNYVVNLLENHETFEYASFADIPLEIVMPYCIDDCFNTAKLYEIYKKELEDKKLKDCADIIDDHAYLVYTLSRNGIAWNEDLAKDLEKEYKEKQLEALRSLILLLEKKGAISLSNNKEIVCKTTNDINYLKDIFNPLSSYKYTGEDKHKTTNVIMSKALDSPMFKFASLVYDSFEYSNQLEMPSEAVKEFPNIYPIYSELKNINGTENKIKHLNNIIDNGKELQESMILANKSYFKINGDNNLEMKCRLKYKDWELTSLDTASSEKLYNIFESIIGIDPNDDSTWTDEFWILYYFKLFKKIDKSLGTYINGKAGRSNVYCIDSSEIYNIAPNRNKSILEREKNENETYITNTEWGPCVTVTKRWNGTQHTVPKKTELMDLRTSRFGDSGIKIKFDYSQAEVRVLAKLANDENLLKAFEEGLDIHCYSGDTEVLTPKGWVRFDELELDKQVMQYDARTGNLSFTECIKIKNDYPIKGYEFEKSHQLVTDKHRLLLCDARSNKTREILAKNIEFKGGSNRFITGGKFNQERLNLSELETRLLVAIHDDGYINSKNIVSFGFKKTRKILRLTTILNKLNLSHTLKYRNRGEFTICLHKSKIINKLINILTKEKIIPCFGLDGEVVINELEHWDGCLNEVGSIVYDSTDEKTVNNLHTLATISGFKCTKVKKYNKVTSWGTCTIYRLNIHKQRKQYMSVVGETKKEVILNKSYCVQVPTGWILTRRNGVCIISGNCFNASLTFKKLMEEVSDNERSMAKGLTFSLLYGAGVSEFANKYTKGNIQQANKIIRDFFEAYPAVKDFIDKMHKEGSLKGEIYNNIAGILDIERPVWAKLLSKYDLIKLSKNAYDHSVVIPNVEDEHEERKERAKFSKCLRNSQNYPIQACSSLMAGSAIREIQREMDNQRLNGKLECFTHDSCEIDVHLKEFLDIIKLIPDCSVEYLKQKYNIPMKVDFEIGVTNNKLIGLDIQNISEDKLVAKFEGKENSLNLLQERLNKNGYVLEYNIEKEKEKIKSIKEMFTTTLGYARDMGKTYKEVEGLLVIRKA